MAIKSQKSGSSQNFIKSRFSIPSGKHQIIFWVASISGIALDLWSKNAVFTWLQAKPYNYVSLIDGVLNFVLRQNAGAAWSMFAGKRWFLISISIVAFFVILAFFYSGSIRKGWMVCVFGLFFAGVSGNLYDRIFNNGMVRDFIDVNLQIKDYHWPTFNVADSLLCISVTVMFASNLFVRPQHRSDDTNKD